jgi:RNA polymerase sigma-70 factor (ECF subfamily)
MARIVKGDPEAMDVLYDRHSRQVYALLFRIVGERQTAEDILQDAFHRSWDRASTYRESEGRVLPWLLGIAHNLAINELRRQQRRPQPAPRRASAEEDEYRQIPAGEPDPADQAWERIRRERVQLAMAELPEPQRVVIDLYAIGHSQSEIATHLNEPLGTVKSRMRRGLHQLRNLLTAEGIGRE